MYTIDDDWVFGNEITEIIHFFFFLRVELKELFIYFILYYFKLFLI